MRHVAWTLALVGCGPGYVVELALGDCEETRLAPDDDGGERIFARYHYDSHGDPVHKDELDEAGDVRGTWDATYDLPHQVSTETTMFGDTPVMVTTSTWEHGDRVRAVDDLHIDGVEDRLSTWEYASHRLVRWTETLRRDDGSATSGENTWESEPGGWVVHGARTMFGPDGATSVYTAEDYSRLGLPRREVKDVPFSTMATTRTFDDRDRVLTMDSVIETAGGIQRSRVRHLWVCPS